MENEKKQKTIVTSTRFEPVLSRYRFDATQRNELQSPLIYVSEISFPCFSQQ